MTIYRTPSFMCPMAKKIKIFCALLTSNKLVRAFIYLIACFSFHSSVMEEP